MEICNEKLIESVREHECLWSKTNREYKNKVLREAAWDAVAVVMESTPYNCKTRWRSLCDRNRRELADSESASGSGSSFRKTWRLKENMSFLNDSVHYESTTSNAENREEESQQPTKETPTPKRRKMDNLFEEVLVKIKSKYEDAATNSSEHEIFFSLLRKKFERLSPAQVDALQGEILLLISKKQ